MTDLNPQPLPPVIRVSVPTEIMNDLERFQKVQASVLGHGGCNTCTSGLQIIWQNYENWFVDLEGSVRPVLPNSVFSAREE